MNARQFSGGKVNINEYFDEGLDYDAFGWIDGQGILVMASPKQAMSDELVVHSNMIDGKHTRYDSAFKDGWVRWSLINNTLWLNCMWNPKGFNTETIIERGVKQLIKKFDDPIKFQHFDGKHAKNGDLHINEYYLEASRNSRAYYSDAKNLPQMFKQFKKKLEGQSLDKRAVVYSPKVDESRQLNEKFIEYHDMFGWIDNNGQVIVATPKHAEDPNWVIHTDLIKNKGLQTQKNDTSLDMLYNAFKKGWVRWFITNGTLTLNTFWNVTESINTEKILRIGVPKIESLALNVNNIKHFKGKTAKKAADLNIGLVITDYTLDVTFQNSEAVEESGETLAQAINKVKSDDQDALNETQQLNEKFIEEYDMFGWVTDTGKLIVATPRHAEDTHYIIHSDLAKENGGDTGQYDRDPAKNALRLGWVRWFIYKHTLAFNAWWTPDTEKLIRSASSKIEKMALDLNKFKHFAGRTAKQAVTDNIGLSITEFNVDIQMKKGQFDGTGPTITSALNYFKQNAHLIKEEKQPVNEVFWDKLAYDMFGWFDEKGRVIVATPKHAKMTATIIHRNLVQEKGLADLWQAYVNGWVRWFVKDNTMRFDCTWNPSGNNTEKIIRTGISKLSTKLSNPMYFRYFGTKTAMSAPELYIDGYDIDAMWQGKAASAKGKTLSQMFSKIKSELGFNDLDESKNILAEKFSPLTRYDMFGWIDKDGKLILASPSDAKSDSLVHHSELAVAHNMAGGWEPQSHGAIRWFIAKNELWFECNWNKRKALGGNLNFATNLRKNVPIIVNQLAQDPKYFKYFNGPDARKHGQEEDGRLQIKKLVLSRLDEDSVEAETLSGLIAKADRKWPAKLYSKLTEKFDYQLGCTKHK